jgi:NADH:ubiquinone oxidoreductase subunit 3 (subunit A)
MILSQYSVVGLAGLLALGLGLLGAALWHPGLRRVEAAKAWKAYRFGYPVYALIFLSFDMEMIFMYPWAVVFAGIGLEAFLDMFVFIAILSAGIAYAWGMGGLEWE